jgi:ADP-ribose pyrophosphatase YjhB (NUDIX family)
MYVRYLCFGEKMKTDLKNNTGGVQSGLEKYPRPSVAVDVVLFTIDREDPKNYRKLPDMHLEVLLIKRGIEPFKGSWALPGGFVRPDETLEVAAARELEEETGNPGRYLEQLFTFSELGRDPRTWVLSCAHMALVPKHSTRLNAGDDAADAAWFRVNLEAEKTGKYHLVLSGRDEILKAMIKMRDGEPELTDNSGLAFDHAKIIAYAVERLRSKLDHTDIALNLMPATFTLTELQRIYESILGKKLLSAAFRRKVAGLVEGVEEYVENAGHRPSQLFRRRDNQ